MVNAGGLAENETDTETGKEIQIKRGCNKRNGGRKEGALKQRKEEGTNEERKEGRKEGKEGRKQGWKGRGEMQRRKK